MARFAHPRYWPTWVGVGALWLVGQLPYPLGRALGAGAGLGLYALLGQRRRIAATNLAQCFPERSPEDRRALLRAHFRSLGVAVYEVAASWWGPQSRLRRLVRIEGLEHVRGAQERGQGVLLLTGHLTTMEIGGHLFALFLDSAGMYRRHKNPLVEQAVYRARSRYAQTMLPRGAIREAVRYLRAGGILWYAPDQDPGPRGSVRVPFFGVPAATTTAPQRLARLSGAAVIPMWVERMRGTRGYRIVLEPPLEDFPSDDVSADTARVNRVIERFVRRIPEQYLWIHRRFKTRGDDEPAFYASDDRR